jgi:hypothetical protein
MEWADCYAVQNPVGEVRIQIYCDVLAGVVTGRASGNCKVFGQNAGP